MMEFWNNELTARSAHEPSIPLFHYSINAITSHSDVMFNTLIEVVTWIYYNDIMIRRRV